MCTKATWQQEARTPYSNELLRSTPYAHTITSVAVGLLGIYSTAALA